MVHMPLMLHEREKFRGFSRRISRLLILGIGQDWGNEIKNEKDSEWGRL